MQHKITFLGRHGRTLDCLLHLPSGHARRVRKRWPFVLYLHAAGERGHDLRELLRNDLPRRLQHAPRFPFVVLSPQCPPRMTWASWIPTLLELLDEMVPHLRANPRRVHVTGASMGGSGTWQLAAADPDRFASAVPICSSIPPLHGWPGRAARLANMPVWAFHGARDVAVPVRCSRVLQAVHRAAGGSSRLTVLPGVGHRAWTPAYLDPRLWRWVANRRLARGRGA